jgi:hypothetical protein
MKGKWMSSMTSNGLLDRLSDFGYLPPSPKFVLPLLERLFVVTYTNTPRFHKFYMGIEFVH